MIDRAHQYNYLGNTQTKQELEHSLSPLSLWIKEDIFCLYDFCFPLFFYSQQIIHYFWIKTSIHSQESFQLVYMLTRIAASSLLRKTATRYCPSSVTTDTSSTCNPLFLTQFYRAMARFNNYSQNNSNGIISIRHLTNTDQTIVFRVANLFLLSIRKTE